MQNRVQILLMFSAHELNLIINSWDDLPTTVQLNSSALLLQSAGTHHTSSPRARTGRPTAENTYLRAVLLAGGELVPGQVYAVGQAVKCR